MEEKELREEYEDFREDFQNIFKANTDISTRLQHILQAPMQYPPQNTKEAFDLSVKMLQILSDSYDDFYATLWEKVSNLTKNPTLQQDYSTLEELLKKMENEDRVFSINQSYSQKRMTSILNLFFSFKKSYENIQKYSEETINSFEIFFEEEQELFSQIISNVKLHIHIFKMGYSLLHNNQEAEQLLQQTKEMGDTLNNLKEDINKERQGIQQLMADATKLGLAQRYTQEKKTLNNEKDKWDFRFNLALYSLIGLGTLEIIVLVCSIYVEAMQKISSTPTIYLGLIPIHIAIIWFVIFFSRRRNEVNRLASDYAHKEVFASSYEAYLEEIKKLKDNGIISKEKEEEAKELAIKLLDSMIGVLSDNPAKSLDAKKTTDELPAKELVNFASEVIKLNKKN